MKLWAYCRSCSWQADQPFDPTIHEERIAVTQARGLLCPRCRTDVIFVEFERKMWMRFGARLLTGEKRVADFVSAPSSRTSKREWSEEE